MGDVLIVKSETFSDQWHVRVYSHAAGSSSRSRVLKRVVQVASQRHILIIVLEGIDVVTLLEYFEGNQVCWTDFGEGNRVCWTDFASLCFCIAAPWPGGCEVLTPCQQVAFQGGLEG